MRSVNEAEIINVLICDVSSVRPRIDAGTGIHSQDRSGAATEGVWTESAILQPAGEIGAFKVLTNREGKIKAAKAGRKFVFQGRRKYVPIAQSQVFARTSDQSFWGKTGKDP